MSRLSREDGFTISELLISSAIALMAVGAALTTFRQGMMVNDSASQLADANQNLRAGTNQMVKDLMMAGRIIGSGGIPLPTGTGVVAFNRPSPPTSPPSTLQFALLQDTDSSLNLGDITTGYQLGPTINGSKTDMVTIMTVDEFMPILTSKSSGTLGTLEGTIDPAGANVLLPTNSLWLTGDPVEDTPPINVGDLVLFKNPFGMSMQTVTSKDTTHIYFSSTDTTNDWFRFNQRSTSYQGTVLNLKCSSPCTADTTSAFPQTSMFRALMITYYVDNITTPGTPRLTRVVNHFTPQALAGVVEDLDLSYDLVDRVYNPSNVNSLPYSFTPSGATAPVSYTANQIRKVNIHVGVRSEVLSKPTQDYVRNHITTSVDVRSLATVSRYQTQVVQ